MGFFPLKNYPLTKIFNKRSCVLHLKSREGIPQQSKLCKTKTLSLSCHVPLFGPIRTHAEYTKQDIVSALNIQIETSILPPNHVLK